jgi:hypothetical protein
MLAASKRYYADYSPEQAAELLPRLEARIAGLQEVLTMMQERASVDRNVAQRHAVDSS